MSIQCILNIVLPENDIINIKFADIFYILLCRYKLICKVAIIFNGFTDIIIRFNLIKLVSYILTSKKYSILWPVLENGSYSAEARVNK